MFWKVKGTFAIFVLAMFTEMAKTYYAMVGLLQLFWGEVFQFGISMKSVSCLGFNVKYLDRVKRIWYL